MHQRIVLEELGYHVLEHRVRQLHRAGHPQATPGFDGKTGHHFLGLLGLQQHGLAMAQEALANIGQRQLACGALQQTRAEAGFQFGNAP
ncbi:hypothetical protein D3C80_1482380 [compost metagenome]